MAANDRQYIKYTIEIRGRFIHGHTARDSVLHDGSQFDYDDAPKPKSTVKNYVKLHKHHYNPTECSSICTLVTVSVTAHFIMQRHVGGIHGNVSYSIFSLKISNFYVDLTVKIIKFGSIRIRQQVDKWYSYYDMYIHTH